MQDIIHKILSNWHKDSGATFEQLEQLKQQLKFRLPSDYEAFLSWSNGGEGWLGSNYFSLWDCEQVLRRNRSAKIHFYLPDVLGIGTDGGDYCYALNYNISDVNPSFVRVPLGDLDMASFIIIGTSFADGLKNLLTTEL